MTLRPTSASANRNGYYVEVTREQKAKWKLSNWAVVTFLHPALALDPLARGRQREYLAVHCQVRTVSSESAISSNSIGADQTIRNALGIPYLAFRSFREDGPKDFYILPTKANIWRLLRIGMARFFGMRFSALRVKSGQVADIEKRYVRVPSSVRATLGVSEADDIVIERPFESKINDDVIYEFEIRNIKQSVFEANDKMLELRQTQEELSPERFIDGRKVLYNFDHFIESGYILEGAVQKVAGSTTKTGKKVWPIELDLPTIFMDFDARSHGGKSTRGQESDPFTPVIVRRSIRSAIGREAVQSGITFGVGLINVAFVISRIYSEFFVSQPVLVYWIAGAISFFITGGLLCLKLRQQV